MLFSYIEQFLTVSDHISVLNQFQIIRIPMYFHQISWIFYIFTNLKEFCENNENKSNLELTDGWNLSRDDRKLSKMIK